MKRVLYLTPVYPPYNMAASLRALGITTELILNETQCIVATKLPRSTILTPIDLTLNKKIPKKMRLIHLIDFEILRKVFGVLKLNNLLIPDDRIDWVLNCFPILVSKLKRDSFDYIYATGPPFSIFILGLLLKLIFKKPLIIEYRDPWINNPYDSIEYSPKKIISTWLEKIILKKADYKVFVSEQLRDFVLQNRDQMNKNTFVIPSGIDLSDYKHVKIKKEGTNSLRFVMTCTIYGQRNPNLFFSVIRKAINSHLLDDINFSIDIYGGFNKKSLQKIIQKYDLEKYVHLIFHPSHQTCLTAQKNADLLVDLSERNVDYPTFSYHLLEYIASGHKILYFGKSDSYKAKFITENQLGYVIPSDTPNLIKESFFDLIKEYKLHQLNTRTNIDEKSLTQFSWKQRIQPLLQIFKK